MGVKKKIGKQRKDKFYRLAKETGFRSRASFKLLQLNRKFEFLQKSRVLVDLCAAPGGWMQVAQQNMPVSSIIVGVDLFPIKPIPGCISIQEDITTDKCRVALTKALQTWKADVVLNDGAPNVGANWLHDAYQQACLTLSALKLATEFLREGGWFITKIFRSKDYNSLLWVLKQLFNKVHATKPQASRNESAEMFVVCQHYKAPDKLDPKFLQPNYVFKDLEIEPSKNFNLFKLTKKAKVEGYAEGDYTMFHPIKAIDFINHENGIEILQNASEIIIEDDTIGKHEQTTNEIRACCKDIKVLGRKELRMLLAWWKKLKEEFKEKPSKTILESSKIDEKSVIETEEIELEEIEEHIETLKGEEERAAKKKRKLANKERRKLQEKMNLKMVLKGDEGPRLESDDVFSLAQIKTQKHLLRVTDDAPDVLVQSDAESDTDIKIKPKKVPYSKANGRLDSSGKFYKNEDDESDSAIKDNSDSEDEESIPDGLGLAEEQPIKTHNKNKTQKLGKYGDNHEDNPLITDLDFRERKEKRLSKVAMWFEKDAFKNLETEADEDFELDAMTNILKKDGKKVHGNESPQHKKGKDDDDDEDEEDDGDGGDGLDYGVDKEISKKNKKIKEGDFEIVPLEGEKKIRKRKLNEEGLALGTLMVSSKKKKRDLVDDSWNRYVFNDENLPDWFVEDEKRHMKKDAPVPQSLIQEYRDKLKEINARPIKKVIEAKARKKRKTLKKLQKAKKKVEAIMENVDVSEREKARQIQKLYKKARQPAKKEVTYVVAKRHTATKRVRRPIGVKGQYRVVDPRMKKDNKQKKKMDKNSRRPQKGGRNKRKK